MRIAAPDISVFISTISDFLRLIPPVSKVTPLPIKNILTALLISRLGLICKK